MVHSKPSRRRKYVHAEPFRYFVKKIDGEYRVSWIDDSNFEHFVYRTDKRSDAVRVRNVLNSDDLRA
jgi:hypothetical protein